jgi:sulfatase maturation enzyme AslB (radical SAM superfamily)
VSAPWPPEWSRTGHSRIVGAGGLKDTRRRRQQLGLASPGSWHLDAAVWQGAILPEVVAREVRGGRVVAPGATDRTPDATARKDPPADRLGRRLRDLRVSVTDRCNFRCPYCMPKEIFGHSYAFLPLAEILSFEELTRVVAAAASLGVTKVRLTGGEPLLRRELDTLVAMLAEVEGITDLALTTNGALLAGKAHRLRAAGLARVTVSLDSLDEARWVQKPERHAATW